MITSMINELNLPKYMFLANIILAFMILSMMISFLRIHVDLATFFKSEYSYSIAKSGAILYVSQNCGDNFSEIDKWSEN